MVSSVEHYEKKYFDDSLICFVIYRVNYMIMIQ